MPCTSTHALLAAVRRCHDASTATPAHRHLPGSFTIAGNAAVPAVSAAGYSRAHTNVRDYVEANRRHWEDVARLHPSHAFYQFHVERPCPGRAAAHRLDTV